MFTPAYREERILLDSALEIRRGDRLQRNAETLETIEVLEDAVRVSCRWSETELPKTEPVHVWRTVQV